MKTRSGLSTQEYIDLEKQSLFQTYKRFPIVVDRAEGCRIYDINGDVYLDFLAGIAVLALGHCHPKIVDAVIEQTKKFMHLSNYLYQPPQILLAEKLEKMTGYHRVFFSNSGSEAMEGTIKLVRRWGSFNIKKEIIALSGGFHGRTYGALSIMDKPLYKDKMGPFLSDTTISQYNNCEQLCEKVNANTAAIVLEFVQGEGGITCVSKEFVDTIIELKKKYGFLIVADEIQAGVGRTGKFFGFNHYDIRPDIITLAKGIGGGLPLGAILADESLANIWEKGMHGTTFGGNPVACAAGLVVLEELENGVMENTVKVGNYFQEKLLNVQSQFPEKIKEVRGKGLMKGLLLSIDASILVNKMLEKKVIANAASGTVLRIVPPLIIGKAEVDEFCEVLVASLKEL